MARKKAEGEDAVWRERILSAAQRCLSVKGFHETTIEDVCRTSLTPRSLLYRYFPNRETLLNETVLVSSRRSLALISDILRNAGSGAGSIERLLELMVPMFAGPTSSGVGQFNIDWWAWAMRNEAALHGFRETWREWREALASLIRSEVGPEPSDETVQAMAALMLAIYNGLLLHATLEGDELDVEAIMLLQQDGWAGILEQVRAEEAEPPAKRRQAASATKRGARASSTKRRRP